MIIMVLFLANFTTTEYILQLERPGPNDEVPDDYEPHVPAWGELLSVFFENYKLELGDY